MEAENSNPRPSRLEILLSSRLLPSSLAILVLFHGMVLTEAGEGYPFVSRLNGTLEHIYPSGWLANVAVAVFYTWTTFLIVNSFNQAKLLQVRQGSVKPELKFSLYEFFLAVTFCALCASFVTTLGPALDHYFCPLFQLIRCDTFPDGNSYCRFFFMVGTICTLMLLATLIVRFCKRCLIRITGGDA